VSAGKAKLNEVKWKEMKYLIYDVLKIIYHVQMNGPEKLKTLFRLRLIPALKNG
jgi:hypothetical protein